MKKLIVVLAVFAMLGAFTTSAMAADWAFYGNARMSTFYEARGTDDFGGVSTVDDNQFKTRLQGNSRIGANVKHDSVKGGFEYGTGVNVRKLFGEWNFGSGKLLAGQTYTPVTFFYSGQVWDYDLGLLDSGAAYGGRRGMLQLTFGDFKIAAIQPVSSTGGLASTQVQEALPRLEASWSMSTDQFNFDLFGGYQSYEIESTSAAITTDIDVTSYILGLSGKVNFGAGWLAGGASFYQNGDSAGWLGGGSPTFNATLTDTNDNDAWMGFLAAGFKASDMASFELGFGYRKFDWDNTDLTQEKTTIYLNSVLNLGPGVFVIPEIGWVDFDNDNASADTDLFYLGAKWQINF